MTLSDEQIQDLLRVGNPTDEECRLIRMGWDAAMRTKSAPDGWMRAIDETLVIAHIGVANAHDTYEQAKAKLDSLIGLHVDIATDPAVNGGFKLVPSINEGVRKVTRGFRWESEAQHHIPTIEIEFEPVSPDSPNDARGWQDRDRIASMLSPEAKPDAH